MLDIARQADEAIKDKDEKAINCLIKQFNDILSTDIPNNNICQIHYCLSNLYSCLSSIKQENASGWIKDQYPVNMVLEINHVRKAISFKDISYKEAKTNLANAMLRQGRCIEALEDWGCNFCNDGDSPFVASYAKIQTLFDISHFLSDPSHKWRYQYEAYILAKELGENLDKTTHDGVKKGFKSNVVINNLLNNAAKFLPLANWQNDYQHRYCKEEEEYRSWCLKNRLFCNPLNDLTSNWIASTDFLQFPSYTASMDTGYVPYLSAAFSSLKREFCFARFLAYEGCNDIHQRFENKELFLTDTLDYVKYSGSVEKTKTALRLCFSVLDGIAALLNVYFECGSKRISFSSKWIKQNLASKRNNKFIDALYWLSCDLTDNPDLVNNPSKWNAPNPKASELRKTRNAMEHGWLRVVEVIDFTREKEHDFAHVLTLKELEEQVLATLKLVRSAIFYLCFSISLNEEAKKEKINGIFCVSSFTPMMDDEFIDLL